MGSMVSMHSVCCAAGLLRLPRHVLSVFPVHRSWGNGRELHKAAFLVISAQISRDSWTEAVFTAYSEGEVEWVVDLKKTIYTFFLYAGGLCLWWWCGQGSTLLCNLCRLCSGESFLPSTGLCPGSASWGAWQLLHAHT